MISKKIPSLLIIQVLLVITLLLYLPLRSKGAPVFIFWPIFWSIVIVSLFIILKSEKKYKILSLVILEICLSLVLLVSAPNIFQTNRDTYFESQYASEIIEKGLWDPELGVGFSENYYGYNPLIHFLLAFVSLTTGLTTYFISKYILFIFIRVMFVLMTFFLISTFVKENKERIIYLATFIFISSFGMAFIEVSRRFISGIFMLFSFYALIKSKSGPNKNIWNFLFYVLSPMIIIGNHSISYLFLIILFGMWVFGIAAKTKIFRRLFNNEEEIKKYPKVLPKLIYFFMVFYLWGVFVSSFLLKNDLFYASEIFYMVFGGYGPRLLFTIKGAKPEIFIYHFYEILTVYSYHFIFFLLSIAGFIFFVVKLSLKKSFESKIRNKTLLLYIGLFSIISYFSLFALMRTTLDSASYIFLWFFCIPLSIFIAYFFDRFYKKIKQKNIFIIFMILISILFYTGHMFSGIYTPRITNRAPDEDIVIGLDIKSQTQSVYNSALWLSKNADKESKILGDLNVLEIYSGMFGFDVSTDEYITTLIYNGSLNDLNGLLLNDRIYFGSYTHTVHYDNLDYLIINNQFFKYPNYLFGKPIDLKKVEKFEKTALINKVYDNKEIAIYKNKE